MRSAREIAHNAKADNGEGAGLGAHAPAERFHHRHLVCLSQLSARCKENIYQHKYEAWFNAISTCDRPQKRVSY